VAWKTCCLPKKDGGLGLIDPEAAVIALMGKWIISAYEHGDTNFKLMLRFCLSHFQPYPRDNWPPSLEWCTSPTHSAVRGSKVWDIIARAWKSLCRDIIPEEPQTFEEWLSSNFWWSHPDVAFGPTFSKARGAALARAGAQFIRDAWKGTTGYFLTSIEAHHCFGLRPSEYHGWESICTHHW
jgi:hypothetical protein